MAPPGTRAVWVLALAMAAAQGAPAGAASHLGTIECASFSPFDNHCSAGPADIGTHATASVGALGYAGSITITLSQSHPFPPHSGRVTWVCHAMLTSADGACGPAQVTGLMVPGFPVTLDCRAGSTPFMGVAVGPVGPWGCRVTV